MDTSGIDMNNPSNLFYYSQLLVFKTDVSRPEIVFKGADNLQRSVLHAFADGFGLEYEYSRLTTEVRITRPEYLDLADSEWRGESVAAAPVQPSSIGANTVSNGWASSYNEPLSRPPDSIADTFHLQLEGENVLSSDFGTTEDSNCMSIFPNEQLSSDLEAFLSADASTSNLTARAGEELPSRDSQNTETQATSNTHTQGVEDDEPFRGRLPRRQQIEYPSQHHPRQPASSSQNIACDTEVDTPSVFPLGHSSHYGVEDIKFPRTQAGTYPKGRSILTDSDREKRMSQYHKEHHNVMQTEIATVFKVDKSTVASVLNHIDGNLHSGEKFIPTYSLTTPIDIPSPFQASSSGSSPFRSNPPRDYFRMSGYDSSMLSPLSSAPVHDHLGDFSYLSQSPPGRAFSSRSSSSRRMSSPGSSPGRSGPLDYNVQANMRAVKAGGGSCWRCKILRKSCNPDTPCVMCPSRDIRSNWGMIGCKRGVLKSHMSPFDMCPQSDPDTIFCKPVLPGKASSPSNTGKELEHETANRMLLQLQNFKKLAAKNNYSELDTFVANLNAAQSALHFPSCDLRELDSIMVDPIRDLNNEILGIIWSAHQSPALESALAGDLQDVAILLCAGGIYQINSNSARLQGTKQNLDELENDVLISKSQTCLRVALEAMQMAVLGYNSRDTHQHCQRVRCQVVCISEMTSSLEEFLDELSRLLFLRENMIQKSQWLAIFYSLCIQSYVRRVLIHISKICNEPVIGSSKHPSRFEQYLHLGIRLYIAASGNYDPLMEDYSSVCTESSSDQLSDAKHYQEAQFAVKQPKWKERGINSSKDYLKHIFEDVGAYLEADLYPPFEIVNFASMDLKYPLVGGFQCKHPGCTAQPFQTQYLLNSHTNVHSRNRPHYCSVKGCPRSEGGRGFKRKNELLRHGLIHASPGWYICPFCPDREHKYPRPDNLQRHVRVHHVDKDKDDPQLRDVLREGRKDRAGDGDGQEEEQYKLILEQMKVLERMRVLEQHQRQR